MLTVIISAKLHSCSDTELRALILSLVCLQQESDYWVSSLQKAPAVWENWKVSGAIKWQNVSVCTKVEQRSVTEEYCKKTRGMDREGDQLMNISAPLRGFNETVRGHGPVIHCFAELAQLKMKLERTEARTVADRCWLPSCWDVMEWSVFREVSLLYGSESRMPGFRLGLEWNAFCYYKQRPPITP